MMNIVIDNGNSEIEQRTAEIVYKYAIPKDHTRSIIDFHYARHVENWKNDIAGKIKFIHYLNEMVLENFVESGPGRLSSRNYPDNPYEKLRYSYRCGYILILNDEIPEKEKQNIKEGVLICTTDTDIRYYLIEAQEISGIDMLNKRCEAKKCGLAKHYNFPGLCQISEQDFYAQINDELSSKVPQYKELSDEITKELIPLAQKKEEVSIDYEPEKNLETDATFIKDGIPYIQ